MDLKWWNTNKMKIAPFAALIMWAISVLCFVFGLSFNSPLIAFGKDIGVYLAFALSVANTIIQLIGNGQKFEKDDWVFQVIWIASYALGISSNTNTLMQTIGIDNRFLEWVIALSLGSMIEIAPEKLIILWLRSESKNVQQQPKKKINYTPQPQQTKYQPKHKPAHMVQQNTPRYGNPAHVPQNNRPAPPYHPIGYMDGEEAMS